MIGWEKSFTSFLSTLESCEKGGRSACWVANHSVLDSLGTLSTMVLSAGDWTQIQKSGTQDANPWATAPGLSASVRDMFGEGPGALGHASLGGPWATGRSVGEKLFISCLRVTKIYFFNIFCNGIYTCSLGANVFSPFLREEFINFKFLPSYRPSISNGYPLTYLLVLK